MTTISRSFSMPDLSDVIRGFDQEAVTALLARKAMIQTDHNADETQIGDCLRKMDRSLIRFCGKFGIFNKGDTGSFQLPEEMNLLPQLLYNLRRSNFVETFNCSPDESAFYRAAMLKETVSGRGLGGMWGICGGGLV